MTHRVRKIFVGCLFSAAYSLGQPPVPDAKTLIEESVQAEAANGKVVANWLGREDVRRYGINGSKRKLLSWQTYEASFLEGRPYYRKTAINGEPLTQGQAAVEEADMEAELQYRKNTPRKDQVSNDRRLGFGLRSMVDSHDFKFIREESLLGRKVWLVEGTLRPDAPLPETKSDGGLSSDIAAWIDQESKLPVREELTVRKEWMNLKPGSKVILSFDFRYGLRLVSQILSRTTANAKGRLMETEQTYSAYKKFAAESQIILNEKR